MVGGAVFCAVVNDRNMHQRVRPLTVCAKTLHFRCLKGSEYAYVQIASNNVLCHHNKRLKGYFQFLYGWGITCITLNMPEKLHSRKTTSPQKAGEAELIAFILVNTIPLEQHLPFKQTNTNTTFSCVYQSCAWPSSDLFF